MTLVRRIRGAERVRLLFLKMPCPADVEIAANAGFDGVILDTEHGPAAAVELEHHLRAADAGGIAALVRVGSLDHVAILSALDAGAAGVIVPHVMDGGAATEVVQAAHYPPRGRRGLALSTRAGRYGASSVAEHLERARAQTLVIVQIEDASAVPRAAEILQVDGVDGVLIGPTDLSISLGHPGDAGHPEVAGAIDSVSAAARGAGVAAATVVSDAARASEWFASGGAIAVFVASQLTAAAYADAVGEKDPPGPEPLVLLPGMLGTDDLWTGVADALRGRLELRHARIDLDDSVQEMADTVLASAPARFALAGHSLGGIVALAIARRAPARITRLVLLNTSARPKIDASWQSMRKRAEAGEFAALVAEFGPANVPAHHGDLIETVRAMAERVGPQAFLRQLRAQETRPDSRHSLALITCPTMVIAGAKDTVAPPRLQEELAAGIPGARLERIDGCGHMSPLEAPEQVAELLLEWAG